MEFHTYKDNLLSIGKASPNVEIKIFTSQGTPAALGEEGEVCVKGEHVTCSYWNETPERFASDFMTDISVPAIAERWMQREIYI